jgi:hypothetical protein
MIQRSSYFMNTIVQRTTTVSIRMLQSLHIIYICILTHLKHPNYLYQIFYSRHGKPSVKR